MRLNREPVLSPSVGKLMDLVMSSGEPFSAAIFYPLTDPAVLSEQPGQRLEILSRAVERETLSVKALSLIVERAGEGMDGVPDDIALRALSRLPASEAGRVLIATAFSNKCFARRLDTWIAAGRVPAMTDRVGRLLSAVRTGVAVEDAAEAIILEGLPERR